MTTAPLGLAALTVLDTAPLDHVGLAERHGFRHDRAAPPAGRPRTTAYPLHEDERALVELERRLADSPVEVFDLAIIRLAADFDPSAYMRCSRRAPGSGPRPCSSAATTPTRPADRLVRPLAELARGTASSPSLEFMPWTAVPDAKAAVEIVAQADGPARSVLVDALHVARVLDDARGPRGDPREWLHYAQMCDGSVPAPADDAELIRHARRAAGAGTGGIDLPGNLSTLPAGLPVSIELPTSRCAARSVRVPGSIDSSPRRARSSRRAAA